MQAGAALLVNLLIWNQQADLLRLAAGSVPKPEVGLRLPEPLVAKAGAAHGREIFGDIPNFTDSQPVVQISDFAE